jgi:hypothetical protein
MYYYRPFFDELILSKLDVGVLTLVVHRKINRL